jgi:hypothetical protein
MTARVERTIPDPCHGTLFHALYQQIHVLLHGKEGVHLSPLILPY